MSDFYNDAQTKLGDFRISALNPVQTKTATTVDYSYDANGNMLKDLNKDIVTSSGGNSIVYNHLNLPQQVTIKKSLTAEKGIISYIYDAAGIKHKKSTVENASIENGNKDITTTTTYLGGMVYEAKTVTGSAAESHTDKMQFISQEEGRIRIAYNNGADPNTPTGFEYDYFLKDHLGNVRSVITEEVNKKTYPFASMETAQAATENTYYSGIDNSRYAISDISNYPTSLDNTTNPNEYVARTNGNDNKIGPGIMLKVMSGDKFGIRVNSWYNTNNIAPGTPVTDLLTALVGALSTGVSGASPSHGSSLYLQGSGLIDPSVSSFLPTRTDPRTTKPKAYLNWILLDEQLKFVNDAGSGSEIVGNDLEFKLHVITDKAITKNGFLYIYVSNETPNINVFFDNLQITHTRGPLLEESHYYPFGLTMAGISSKALNGIAENKLKFNDGTELQNKEFSDGSGLEWYATNFRGYDPKIGRFHQIDPIADLTNNHSPYAFVQNNPLLYNDPLGLDTLNANKDGTLPTVRPDGSSLQDTDVILGEDGGVAHFYNGEGWQASQQLENVTVSSGSKASGVSIPWFIDPGMSGLENHLGNTLNRYASDGMRGFNYGRPWLPGPRQRVYDRLIKQEPFLRTRPVNVRLPFSREIPLPRNVVQGAAKVLKIGGFVTAAVSVASTEAKYREGGMSNTHRAMNHVMTAVGFFWPWGTLAAVTYSLLEDSIYGKQEE